MTTADDYINEVLDMLPLGRPMRAQIAMELRAHIAERVADGHSLDDVLRQLGDPVKLADSYLSAETLVAASFGRRAAAKLIDVLSMLVVMAPVAWLVSRLVPSDAVIPTIALVIAFCGGALLCLYTVIAEFRFGQTLGKHLRGIGVVRESGRRIGFGQAIVRQLPMLLQMYWIDVFFALFTERSQRAFELLSKTRVVLVSPPESEIRSQA